MSEGGTKCHKVSVRRYGMSKKKSEREEALRLPEGIPDTEETPLSGLTDEEAAAAAESGLSNKPSEEAGKTVFRIIASNTFTWFNLLNILLAAALAVVGAYRNMLFLGVVVSNTLIGIIQELRAKKTVERLKLLSEAPVAVMRGGEERRMPAEQTVRGDIAVLRAGDQIPADAVVVDGGCTVCEALLTGEADGVPKKRGDWLYSGSYLTAGKCRIADACDAVRKRDFGQALAAGKRRRPDACDAIRNGDLCQTGAAEKCLRTDACHAIRNNNFCHACADVKCTDTDAFHAVRNGNFS